MSEFPRQPRSVGGRITRTYRKWASMWARCTNPTHPAFPYYGAKGLKVCDRWRDYDAFYADMGEAPPGLWIDRIDLSKGYEPGNVRWVTPKESAQNRSQGGLRNIRHDSLRQKAKRAGLSYRAVYQRMQSGLWTEQEALSTPVKPRRRP